MKKNRRRLREVVWFEALEEFPDLPRGDVAFLRGLPYFYLVSIAIFTAALVLAVLSPWGVPYGAWAILAGITGVGLRFFSSQECENQDRSPDGFYAFRLWCWLLAGGAIRQALRTIAVNRRSRAATSAL